MLRKRLFARKVSNHIVDKLGGKSPNFDCIIGQYDRFRKCLAQVYPFFSRDTEKLNSILTEPDAPDFNISNEDLTTAWAPTLK